MSRLRRVDRHHQPPCRAVRSSRASFVATPGCRNHASVAITARKDQRSCSERSTLPGQTCKPGGPLCEMRHESSRARRVSRAAVAGTRPDSRPTRRKDLLLTALYSSLFRLRALPLHTRDWAIEAQSSDMRFEGLSFHLRIAGAEHAVDGAGRRYMLRDCTYTSGTVARQRFAILMQG
ncbi:hypothetical protein K431DRAFT_161622 [Polychaeton citri CBS 116435]|uniref:Uncharacterized protein n=1 Tax=Polychaeton citri CBS 116435 TaxID=1314669 RepID=A0A9P4PY65_9PEZI|nr:hypothetical protein K431DRAFT_161622 [Polychaeton citri CBS 116435]